MMANWWQHGQKQKFQLSLMDQIMKNMFFLFTAVLGMTFSNAVTAEEGFYAGILGGANWLTQCNRHHEHVDFKAGYLVGASLGYTWCNNWSAEAEFTYRNNQIRKIKAHQNGQNETIVYSGSSGSGSGYGANQYNSNSSDRQRGHGHPKVRSYAIMANVRYDFALDYCFTPYLRAGIGYANLKVEKNHHNHNGSGSNQSADLNFLGSSSGSGSYGNCSNNFCHRHRNENSFAYQVGLGVSMPIGCNTALDIGYNWLGAQHDINNHSLVFAARYTF